MFCPNCGARNADADTTCQKCGYNLKEAAGAKFKGTMLMMNNPAAAELRRSVPPVGGAAPGANPGPKVPPPAATSPTEAQQMRAKLKGTMIGVAPPAAALMNPPQPVNPGQAATPAARQPSAPPGYSQPGPGQVNAPGAGIHRGGGTMIGTGIGVPGQIPRPGSVPAPAQPAASPHAATALLPVSEQPSPQHQVPGSAPQGFASTYGAGVPNPGPAATVRSAADPHPLAQTQVAAGANESFPSGAGGQVAVGYSEPAGTRAMSQFEQRPQRPVNTLEGTMVAAGGIPTAPRTDSMPQVEPQFSAHAGSRTDTPPMGFPATAGQNSYTGPGYTGPGYSGSATATSPSKGKTILFTVMTCGLYQLFKKAK